MKFSVLVSDVSIAGNKISARRENVYSVRLAIYLRRRVHEVKLQQILNSQGLEKKDNICQVCSLNFWHRGHKQLVFVRTLREKSKTLAENTVHKTNMLLKKKE